MVNAYKGKAAGYRNGQARGHHRHVYVWRLFRRCLSVMHILKGIRGYDINTLYEAILKKYR
ncbi:MAG: hypothetical protein WDO19_24710 [Bacteroidota bacterium]